MLKRISAIVMAASMLLGVSGLNGWAGSAYADSDPPIVREVPINGFERAQDWTTNDGGIALTPDTEDKTEGAQSLGITYPVPDPTGDNAWREVYWQTKDNPVDLSAANSLKFDIRPVGTPSTGDAEPIRFKLVDASQNKPIYESAIPAQAAGQWNTFELDLRDIPAASRAAITYIVFYIWNKDPAIAGRTSLSYKFDNLRAVRPVAAPVEQSLNGFETDGDWQANAGDIAMTADTSDKTEGARSLSVTFPVSDPAGENVWKEIHWNASANPLDLSAATALRFDLEPVGPPTSGDWDPIRFKLVDAIGGTVYEAAIPTHTMNNNPWTVQDQGPWKTYSLDLTGIPEQNRAAVTYVVFYVFNKDGSIGGRASLQYKLDNLRMLTTQVQGVTASPGSSAVQPGTEVTLSTTTAGAQIYYTLDGSDPRFSASRTAYEGPIAIVDVTQIRAYAQVAGQPSSPVSAFQYTIGTGTAGEELYGMQNNVADTGDRMIAGIRSAGGDIDQDGFLRDWSGQTGFKLPANAGKQVKINGWQGDSDLSADVSLAYDETNLYMHVKVKDDHQSDYSGDSIWRGDSVQVAFSKDGAVYGPEYGFSYGGGTPSKFRWNSGSAKLGVDAVKLKVRRDETAKETTYDIVLPWLAALPAAPGDKVPFTLLVNDDDGGGRKGYIEWTPGIGSGKDATSMGTLFMLKQGSAWASSFYGPQNGVSNTPYNYVLSLSNFGTEAAELHVNVPAAGLDGSVTVPAGKVLKKTIQVTFPTPGVHEVSATVSNGAATTAETIRVSVIRDAERLTEALDALNARLPALDALLAQAAEAHIPVDYDTVNRTVIGQFIPYGKDDISHGYLSRAEYVVSELEALYEEAMIHLKGCLDGSQQALEVPKYVSGHTRIEGGSFIGDTQTSDGAAAQQRPIFFTGYGHFNQAKNDIPLFNDLGANIMQMEFGPNNVVMAPAEGSNDAYSISESAIAASVVPVLQQAEAHHVAVSLLLSPHYFPDWALQKWPDLKNGNGGFLHYNINDPRAKTVIEAYLNTIIPAVKDYKSLHSFVLSNEPTYDTRLDSYAVAPWHQFLESKYKDIGKLNALYGTGYGGFADVPMPAGKTATLSFYDWTTFNNEYFSEWHAWMAGIIHKLAPDVPVSTKMMAKLDDAVTLGLNPEDFTGFTDLNGNDNWNYFGSGISGYMKENFFYDLQNSLRQAPVLNTETHIIADRDTVYSPEQAKHVETSLFQSAVHGKSGSVIWTWERTYDTASDFYGSVLERPDVVKAIGKLNLDLNRLAGEVTALQQVKPQAAILYSLPSLVYSGSYQSAMDKAYEALTLSGQKAGFVSEKQAQSGGLEAYKLLIVPQASHVGAATLTAIRQFAAAGGHIIVIGDAALSADENNQPLNEGDRSAVLSAAVALGDEADTDAIKQAVRTELSALGLMKVVLKDKSTGKPVDGVEWQSTTYGGKTLVDIANYDATSAFKTIAIEIDGQPAGTASELINGGTIDTGSLKADLERPYLLLIDAGSGNEYVPPASAAPASSNVVQGPVVHVKPKLADGRATGAISADEFAQALEKAGTDRLGRRAAAIELQQTGGALAYALQIPARLFEGQDGRQQLKVQTPFGSLILPLNMLDKSVIQGATTIQLSIKEVEAGGPGDDVKHAVEIELAADGKPIHWSNPDSQVVISIPYAPTGEETDHTERLAIRYIDDAGGTVPVPNGKYDAATGTMLFKVAHFSRYAVVYTVPRFDDATAVKWAQQAIVATASKGILSGTSATLFSPGQRISRAEFLDALVKTLGLTASIDSNFSDLSATSNYYESVGVARKLGIANGTGSGLFKPDSPITRQEMSALVVRAMQVAGMDMKDGTSADLNAFADGLQVAGYAGQSMATLVKNGIIQGDGKNLLPAGQVTRAQTAVLLYRIL